MNTAAVINSGRRVVWTALAGGLLTVAIIAICCVPTEQTMGDAQRIVYVHVAVAWLGLLGFVAVAGVWDIY